MNAGKKLFAQLMDSLPWKTFGRIVTRYGGDRGVRTLRCVELFQMLSVTVFEKASLQQALADAANCSEYTHA